MEGVGYATIQDVLASVQFPIYFLVLLFVAKLLATSLTLGSGASGGGAYGVVLHRLFPALDISAPAFAVAGIAGVVGGATGAAMAAIVMIFEMTRDYTVTRRRSGVSLRGVMQSMSVTDPLSVSNSVSRISVPSR
jgi:CIC family chloride channel protein